MIRSFGDRRTRRFFEGQRVAAYQGLASQAVRRLVLLDSAETLGDLAALPSTRPEAIGWGAAERWMRMQASYALAQARRERIVAERRTGALHA